MQNNNTEKTKHFKKIIISVLVLIIFALLFILYNSTNKLVSNALKKSFESSLASDVYQLSFDNLAINLFGGDINVKNVELKKRDTPLKNYDYINSSLQLTTNELLLEGVDIIKLLLHDKLILSSIAISNPTIEMVMTGQRNIFLPFPDSSIVKKVDKSDKKIAINAYHLNNFQLINANLKTSNSTKGRAFNITGYNLELKNLKIEQLPNQYNFKFDKMLIGIDNFKSKMDSTAFRSIAFRNFLLGIDQLDIKVSRNSYEQSFKDVEIGIDSLNMVTQDSILTIKMNEFDLLYSKQHIGLNQVSLQPNIPFEKLSQNYEFQKTDAALKIENISISGIQFDSLINKEKLIIETLSLNKVYAQLFKDNTRPKNLNKFPLYLGQTVAKIPLALQIDTIKATEASLENTERKPDGALAITNITNITATVTNFSTTNLNKDLKIEGEGLISDKVKFNTTLEFSYVKPQFTFDGIINTFDLTHLNDLLSAYTPAKIVTGTADKIAFSGFATENGASGNMAFLYHNLKVDFMLEEKAKWKNSIVAFAANRVVHTNNPISEKDPPRLVKFRIDRDENKGFVNVIIKSILDGFKETIIMSKENRKAHAEAKKEFEKKD